MEDLFIFFFMTIDNKEPKNNREKILENAYLLGFSTNRKWFEKILHFGWGTSDGVDCRDTQITFYKESMLKMFDIFKGHYKDNFDVQLVKSTILFKVLYPEFIIKNSEGKQSLIRDLLVIHTFTYSPTSKNIFPNRIQGMRLTRTSEEIYSGYNHSHLGSSSYDNYCSSPFNIRSFCVGNSTDISLLESEFFVEMDWNRAELFLFVVDSMVEWESLEGTPYIRMTKIQDQNYQILTGFDTLRADEISKWIIASKEVVDVDFYYAEGKYRIKPNKKASDYIKRFVLERFNPSTQRNILCTYNYALQSFIGMDVKNVIKGRPEVHSNSQGIKPYNIFNGVKRYCKAIETSPEERKAKKIPIEDYIIYPKFLNYVIRDLEQKLYKKTSTRSAIAHYNSINNTK